MTWRVAINGYGRIGQCILRALYQSPLRTHFKIVAINELADIDTIAYLTKYDSTHGRFPLAVNVVSENELSIDGDKVKVVRSAEIEGLPWADLNIDLVMECTGSFSLRSDADKHLATGAKRVMFSQPAEALVDRTIVYGVNESTLNGDERIVSNASCTTNAVVPVLHAIQKQFGVEYGSITTMHSAMNDQPMIDAYHHQDLRRTRSGMVNMVPVNTALAKGVERILPEFANKLSAVAMRVPTINVSAIDLTVKLCVESDAVSINRYLKEIAQTKLVGIMDYTETPLASSDFIQDSHSCIIDGSQTRVSGGFLLKLLIWFDNEWGFANRMLDVARHWQRV